LASNLDNKTFKVDGAPLASLAKGLSAFRQQTPTTIRKHFFAVLSCERKIKKGAIVGRQVGVGHGGTGGAVLDQSIKSDESRRIVYLERENARLQRLVAELLVKNEQLRQMSEPPSTVAD
jgi:hypothetical protein